MKILPLNKKTRELIAKRGYDPGLYPDRAAMAQRFAEERKRLANHIDGMQVFVDRNWAKYEALREMERDPKINQEEKRHIREQHGTFMTKMARNMNVIKHLQDGLKELDEIQKGLR